MVAAVIDAATDRARRSRKSFETLTKSILTDSLVAAVIQMLATGNIARLPSVALVTLAMALNTMSIDTLVTTHDIRAIDPCVWENTPALPFLTSPIVAVIRTIEVLIFYLNQCNQAKR